MALIERDADVSDIYKKRPFTFKFPWFKIGMLFFFIGLGAGISMLAVALIQEVNQIKFGKEIIAPTMIFSILTSGGLGMILAHRLDKPKAESNG